MPFQKGQSGNPKGKPRGAQGKATLRREAEIAAAGLTPLQFMLTVLRNDEATSEDRKWAAQNAAPYVHPKLATVQHQGDKDNPLNVITTIERVIVRPENTDR